MESDRKRSANPVNSDEEEKNRFSFGIIFGEQGDRQETNFSFGKYPLLFLQQNFTALH